MTNGRESANDRRKQIRRCRKRLVKETTRLTRVELYKFPVKLIFILNQQSQTSAHFIHDANMADGCHQLKVT